MLNIIFVDDLPISTDKAQAAFRAICDRYGITCDNSQKRRRKLSGVCDKARL